MHRFTRRAMGSPFRLTIVGADPVAASRTWDLVSDEVEAAEQAMSRFRDSSDLTTLNRAIDERRPVVVDRRLIQALVAAERARRVTGGRFDARILSALDRLGYRGAELGPTAPADGLGVVGMPAPGPAIDPRASTAILDMPVDLGGIGKGLTLRWAWQRIERTLGVHARAGVGALLEAGGDLVVGGPSPDGGPWIVGIGDPTLDPGAEPPDDPVELASIAVELGAVATSSIQVHRWTGPDGRPAHHLIDPSTGQPGGSGLLSVTVHGPDPAWAEVWSKTLFLAGSDGIVELARRNGLAAWWVTDDGSISMTAAARPRTAWIVGEDAGLQPRAASSSIRVG